MIKCEVVFKGNVLHINGYLIATDGEMWDVYINKTYKDSFIKLEQAIAYCMENSK